MDSVKGLPTLERHQYAQHMLELGRMPGSKAPVAIVAATVVVERNVDMLHADNL